MTDPSLKRPASPGGEVDAAAAARAAGAPPAGGSNPPPPPPSAPEEDISHGQRLAADAGRADRGVPRVDGGGGGAAAAAAAPPPQSATLLVPASAAWFSYASVHALEKEALPEWFDGRAGGGDGAAYRATRNALVDAGRAAVAAGGEGRRLSFTGARAALAGTDGAPATDGPSLLRLHTFLDYWGIINFAGVGGQAMATAAAALPAGTALVPFLGRRDRHGRPPPSEPPLPPGAAPRFFCSAMPWVDCTPLRYHCTRVPDVDLCPEAYADGRFPPGCSGRDFVRLEGGAGPPLPPGATAAAAQLPPGVPPTPAGAADWADQETLLLLEGVEVYGDDWAEVAEHVGTKSAAACLRRFLQLPLADSVASALEAPGGAPGNGSRPVGEPVADGPGADRGAARPPLPFADAGNPVLAQVACLAAMVGPRVAAAAAARAMEVIAEEEGGMGGGADAPVPDATARAAAAAGLAAAAVKARALAAGEEREVLRMAASAAAALATRIAAKVKALDDLGVALDKERAALDRARDAAYVERRALESRRVGG